MNKLLVIWIFILSPLVAFPQDELLELLEEGEEETVYALTTFDGTRIVNGHSVEMRGKNELEFLIQHRFGTINDGFYDLFGLDEANIRFGLEYGVTDNIGIGIGRSSFEKTYDGFFKWRLLRQQTGRKNIPVSMTFFTSMAINTLRFPDEAMVTFNDRLSYATQVLIARKFGKRFSLQLMPTWVHINTVEESQDPNDLFSLGFAGKYKITRSVSLTFEYYYQFNQLQSIQTYNPLGFGIDIETGGHVFQIHFTNSRTTFERAFITQTTDDFWNGDIRLGFNISRTFALGGKKKKWDD